MVLIWKLDEGDDQEPERAPQAEDAITCLAATVRGTRPATNVILTSVHASMIAGSREVKTVSYDGI